MLNEEQQEIVEYKESSLIIAGAGSGKTHTLVHKILSLIDNDVSPESILALTFTKKAAIEMDERLDNAIDNVYNFHALCLDLMMLVSKESPELIAPFKKGFSILDDYEQTSILSKAIKDHQNFEGLDGSVDFYVKTGVRVNRESLKSFVERIQKLKDDSVDDVLATENWSPAERYLVDEYNKYQIRHNTIDFADMIRIGINICNSVGNLGFTHIFVDELQDTNKNQFSLLEALYKACEKPVMFGVGDVDQAIYEWRSAKPDNVFLFQSMFDTEMFKLVKNYRSKSHIVLTANSLIQNNVKRVDKVMVPVDKENGIFEQIFPSSDKEEAKYFADEICKIKPDETASLLMRTNRQLNQVEALLRSRRVNFTIRKDASMMNRADVKATREILNLALHPENPTSLSRVLGILPGFGLTFINDVITNRGTPTRSNAKTKESWANLQHVLQKIRQFDSDGNSDAIISLFSFRNGDNEYSHRGNINEGLKLLLAIYDDPDNEPETLNKGAERVGLFTDALSNFNSVQTFLYGMAMDTGDDNSANDGEDAKVHLQTIHGSKGLEFDHVFMGGITEDFYQLDDEEARRLLYVGMTRAKSRLVMSSPSCVMGREAKPSGMMREASL